MPRTLGLVFEKCKNFFLVSSQNCNIMRVSIPDPKTESFPSDYVPLLDYSRPSLDDIGCGQLNLKLGYFEVVIPLADLQFNFRQFSTQSNECSSLKQWAF